VTLAQSSVSFGGGQAIASDVHATDESVCIHPTGPKTTGMPHVLQVITLR
jgi:hypothetical protein